MISVRGVTRAAVVAVVCVFLVSAAAAAVDIQTVPVGIPGNMGELSGSGAGGYGIDRICGAVAYSYNIGKYEVTAGQYKEFLNAVAKTDTYGLYNTDMSNTGYGSGITRSGSSGSYDYSVDANFVNRPVNYVSFWDACRFANWLHNGQGNGSTETGAYTLTSDGIANNTITRNDEWQWAVTSEDEWYKAAYHKNDGVTGNYWDYPTSSNTAPGQGMADASGNNANYYGTPYPIDSGKYTTVAGEFENSDSPYGTFDQGGNVWEWNEAIISGSYRGLRGGSFSSYDYYLHAAGRYSFFNPSFEDGNVGFRVTTIAATDRTWLAAATTSDWMTDGNWTPSGVPVPGNEVVFDAKGANMPNLGAAGSAKSIAFKTGDWTISQSGGSQTLTVATGNITSIGGAGTTNTIQPQVQIGAGATAATLDIKGDATHNLVLTAPLDIGSKTLIKNGIGTLTTAAITAGTVNVNAGRLTVNSSIKNASLIYIGAGSKLATSATVRSTNVTAALNIEGGSTPTGTLDLNDGLLAINYTGDSPIDTVRAQIVSAYNATGGGDWGGPGITSALLAGGSTTNSIGYAFNGESAVWFDSGIPFGDTTAVAANAVLVRYTLIGDVNLDGIVDDSDISILSNNYGFTDISWADGDVYGYDGIVSDDDVGLQANNYGMMVGQLTGGISAVPEPATLSLLALGGLLALCRRR